jgi:hypothetical protein
LTAIGAGGAIEKMLLEWARSTNERKRREGAKEDRPMTTDNCVKVEIYKGSKYRLMQDKNVDE